MELSNHKEALKQIIQQIVATGYPSVDAPQTRHLALAVEKLEEAVLRIDCQLRITGQTGLPEQSAPAEVVTKPVETKPAPAEVVTDDEEEEKPKKASKPKRTPGRPKKAKKEKKPEVDLLSDDEDDDDDDDDFLNG